MKEKIKLLLCGVFILASLNSYAQVTFGSSETTAKGALLQLKNINGITDGRANATKGLLLPRVYLKHSKDLVDYENNKKSHTGLVVYSVSPFCNDKVETNLPGVYVFDGNEWNPLAASTSAYANPAKVWVTLDHEGDQFRAARFGNQIWMVDNLSTKVYDTESEAYGIITPSPTPETPVVGPNNSAKQLAWCYAGPDVAIPEIGYEPTGLNDYFYKTNRAFGLLYSWIYATGNASAAANLNITTNTIEKQKQSNGLFMNQRVSPNNSTPGEYEVETYQIAKTGKPYIQGICPNGWHIPSDREYTDLEKELFNSPEKYSFITKEEQQQWSPNTWNSDWEKFDITSVPGNVYQSWRVDNTNSDYMESQNLASVFKSFCFLPQFYDFESVVPAKSLSAAEGGFAVLPTGDITSTGLRNYGKWTYLMTSSFTHTDSSTGADFTLPMYVARGFYFSKEAPSSSAAIYPENLGGLLGNGNPSMGNFNSVRCIYHGDGTFKGGMPESWRDLF